jgi:hypothetical protein
MSRQDDIFESAKVKFKDAIPELKDGAVWGAPEYPQTALFSMAGKLIGEIQEFYVSRKLVIHKTICTVILVFSIKATFLTQASIFVPLKQEVVQQYVSPTATLSMEDLDAKYPSSGNFLAVRNDWASNFQNFEQQIPSLKDQTLKINFGNPEISLYSISNDDAKKFYMKVIPSGSSGI